jgi:hypothetical protein
LDRSGPSRRQNRYSARSSRRLRLASFCGSPIGPALAYLNGGKWKIVGEFTEVEGGKRNDRPKLAEALKACRKRKATLVIRQARPTCP